MSYILEALKKSQQERQIGHVPDISQIQDVPLSRRPAPRWPRWLLAALLLNAVILVVLAWRTWETRMANGVDETPPVAVSSQPAASAPAVRDEAPTAPIMPAPVPLEAPPLPEPVTQQPQPAPMDEFELGSRSEPVPVADVVPSVSSEAPRWQDLPLEERTNLPAPRIDVHVFAQEPERRFVLINLHKYQVGDTLDDGTTLEAILNDGIVLSYGGRQYRVDRP